MRAYRPNPATKWERFGVKLAYPPAAARYWSIVSKWGFLLMLSTAFIMGIHA